MDEPPPRDADHAAEFSHRWADRLDEYCALRKQEVGIPDDLIGADDPYRRLQWRAFVADERTGGHLTTGITVNSGVLNPELLKGKKGSLASAKAKLRDRIDAIVAHEWEEYLHGTHEAALKHAPKTALPISDGARRILRAMGR